MNNGGKYMPESGNSKIRTYIRRTRTDRTTGKTIAENYLQDSEITEDKYIDMLLYAFVGNLDTYVTKILSDLKKGQNEAC
jgi:hypothetical protein